MSEKIPVYEDEHCNAVIGHVSTNSKLDRWNGSNYNDGTSGNHLGYTRLTKSHRFVLIHTTDWIGGHEYGYVVSPETLIKAAIQNGCLDDVLEDYPELKVIVAEIIDTD